MQEHLIFPQSGENKNNQWKFIVNQDNFKQGVHIEKCVCVSQEGGLRRSRKVYKCYQFSVSFAARRMPAVA